MPLIGTLISHKLSLITAHKPDYNNAREPPRQATRLPGREVQVVFDNGGGAKSIVYF